MADMRHNQDDPGHHARFLQGGLAALSVLGIVYLLGLIGLRALKGFVCADRCNDPSLYDGGWEAIVVAGVVAGTTLGLLVLARSHGQMLPVYRLIVIVALFTIIMFAVPML